MTPHPVRGWTLAVFRIPAVLLAALVGCAFYNTRAVVQVPAAEASGEPANEGPGWKDELDAMLPGHVGLISGSQGKFATAYFTEVVEPDLINEDPGLDSAIESLPEIERLGASMVDPLDTGTVGDTADLPNTDTPALAPLGLIPDDMKPANPMPGPGSVRFNGQFHWGCAKKSKPVGEGCNVPKICEQ